MAIPLQTIFLLYIPLALSSMMIAIAHPIINAGLTRLPDPEVSVAAWGLVWSLGLLLESPIVMILSTSIALVKDRHSYAVALRFTLALTTSVGILCGAVAFSPLYDRVMLDVISVPADVARAGQPALQIITFWSLGVGLRRLYHGILIRHRLTRLIAFGTVIRLVTMIGIFVGGILLTDLPSPIIAAVTQLLSVTVEAVIAIWWARDIVHREVLTREPEGPPLTYRRLITFHWPLAATSAMRVLVQPIIAAGLARMADPQLTLAAWPIVFSTVNLLMAATASVQEITIALVKDNASARSVRRFVHAFGLGLGAFLALVAFTPIVDVFLARAMGASPAVHGYAVVGIRWLVLIPALMAHLSMLRGWMSVRWQTGAVRTGMIVNVLTLSGVLALGVVFQQIPAMTVAGLAMLLATAVETGYLTRAARASSFARPVAATALHP